MGWIGPKDQLFHVAVVSDDAVYLVAGAPRNLASALGATSYGLRVHVV